MNETVVNHKKSRGYIILKRLIDVVASFLGIICLSPVFLIVSLLIFLEDGGKPIFIQERSGLNNVPFKMFKFRSMQVNASKMREELGKFNELDGPAFKMKEDPRVTKIGAFIRKTSIDELPQLLNVLIGNMSLVGPRPHPV